MLITVLKAGDVSSHRNVMITIVNANFLRLDLKHVFGEEEKSC